MAKITIGASVKPEIWAEVKKAYPDLTDTEIVNEGLLLLLQKRKVD